MKLKKRFKKIASLIFALGMVFSTVQVPVTPVFAQDSLLQIDVSGSGTVLVTQDGKTTEVKEKAEITGTAGEKIHVAAKAADGNQITAFAVFTDQDQKGLAFGDTADKECDVELGKEKYIAIDFGVLVDQPDGGIQTFASQADYDKLQPGATGSGQWWTSNQDMFAQLFPISWIHGDLEPFSQYIVGQNASCIDPGHIGITDNNAYGIKTLGYTYRVESRNNKNITVYIESDYLRKADGTPATGWSAALGRIDTYQRFALRVNIPVPYRTIHLNLTKQSANPQLTNGNDCYSLAGAEYGVYSDPGCSSKIGMITTGGDGRGHVSIPNMNPSMGTVYIKELKASKGYLLNPEVITVNLDGNGNGNAVSKETPGNDPLTIYLNKISEDGQYVQNAPSLEGAEFTVKYYDGQYTNIASLPASPTRSWVIRTTFDGNAYFATLDDAHKVSGDDFYRTPAGNPTLPLGTVTVQETKAPAGYTLSGASYSVNNGTVNQADGVALFNIKDKGNGVFGMVGGNAYTVTEKMIRSGSFSIQKRDAETGDKPQGGTAGLSAKFKLTNNNDYGAVLKGQDGNVLGKAEAHQDFDYIITTDEQGNWTSPDAFIPYGHYTLTEIEAPEGYLINQPASQEITVSEEHQVITLNAFTDNVKRGGFKVQKHDTQTGTRPQGDTNLKISFKVVNKSANPVVVNGKTYARDEVVYENSTNDAGYFESANDLLPFGHYALVETKAPIGYTSEGATITEFDVVNDHEIVDLTGNKINNRVDLGKMQLHKTLSEQGNTSWVEDEAGAVFGVVRKMYVDQTGSVMAALAKQYGVTENEITNRDWLYTNLFAIGDTADTTNKDGSNPDLMTGHEYAVIKTNDKGIADTGDKALAYGEYVVSQLVSGNDEITCNPNATYNITVDKDDAVITLQASNTTESYYLRLVKKDADTGELSTFNSAEFKIFQLTDAKGKEVNKYVTQKVGSKTYDTFRTSSKNGNKNVPSGTFYVDTEDKGVVTTPLKLKAGTYRIEEVGTPAGFVGIDPIEVEIKKAGITETDEDGNKYIAVEVENKRAYGELEVNKTIKDIVADKDYIPSDALQQIVFTLTAKEDVINPDDGSILTKKGDVAKDIYGNEVGTFHVDENGHAVVTKIALGKYTLTESYIPSSLAENTKTWDVVFEQKKGDTEKKKYSVSLDIENKPTIIELSKKAVTGKDELPGAKIQIIEKQSGTVMDTYTSTDKPHVIKGLQRNKTYIMRELLSPNNGEYVKASDIEFTVNADGTVSTVTMVDKLVSFEKKDADGNFVDGAEITVTDADGNVVDKWTSDGETAHRVNGLEVGKTYTVSETVVPEGYVKFNDFTFTVEDDGKDQTITAVDKRVFIDKVDSDGKELPGAHIQILDENGNVVDEWVSTSDGAHPISGLEVGKTYTWHENYMEAVGYYYAEDYTFTVADDGLDQHMEMVDHPIRYQIAKVDDNGEYVDGIKLQLTDITDAENPAAVELPNEGLTAKEPIKLDTVLLPEHTYLLEEVAIRPGVHPAASIQFTVPKFGKSDVTTITMLDKLTGVRVQKVDNYGNPVPGAKLQLIKTVKDDAGKNVAATDDNGDPIIAHEFVSTDDLSGVDVSQYVEGGATYILHEVEAPFGFDLAPDTVFTVDGTQDHAQVIVAVDRRKTYYVSAIKVDAQDQTKYLKGAEITLFRPDGTVATDVDGKECVGVTDGTGVLTWHVEFNDDMSNGGYYVQETGAPEGYRINPNKFTVELSEDYDFAADNAIKIIVNDEALPMIQTGVYDNPAAWAAVLVSSLAAVVMLLKKR